MDTLRQLFDSQKSFFQTGYTMNIKTRLQKLKELKRVLIDNEFKIYDTLKEDLNKPVQETFLGEFMGVMHELDTSISKLRRWSKKRRTRSPLLIFPSKASIFPEPYGQVLIISPWNYPLDLCLSPLVGAVTAGNTVILKPSEYTPHTSQLLKELMSAVFPEQYVSVQKGGIEVSQKLLQFQFDYIFFTGSVSVGREVMKKAAEHLTPVTLELGGKCPVILNRNYNLKQAAKSIVWGKYFNAGQSCVAPDYVFVHEDDFEAFAKYFTQYTNHFLQNKNQDYTRIINEKHFDRLIGYLSQGEIINGGDYSRENLFISPTLILPKKTDCPLMQDEIFGPILPVVKYCNQQEVVNAINSREKALVIYIFSSKRNEHNYFLKNTSSGNICINDTLLNYVNKNLPFGGVGHSGMGQYHGKASFDTFSNFKSIHQKLSPNFSFRYPPYNNQYKRLRPFKKVLNKNI